MQYYITHNCFAFCSLLALGVMDCAEFGACAAQYIEILMMPLAGRLKLPDLCMQVLA